MTPEPGAEQRLERHYDHWKRHGSHLAEYFSEFWGTAFLLLCVVGVVSVMFGSGSPVPRAVPSPSLRLLLAGLMLGSAGSLVAISPLGRLSGAHLNPAVSVGFWMLGKMHGRDMAGYVLSQMAGGLVGAFAGSRVFGRLGRQVHEAALRPAAQVGTAGVFGSEMAATFALSLVLYTCVSHKPLLRWTPLILALSVGLLVWADGSYSGAGMNPARWFGPAFTTRTWLYGAAYALAPVFGALAAAGLRRTNLFHPSMPHTGKFLHDSRYRSVFKRDSLPTRIPASVVAHSVRPSLSHMRML